MYRIKDTEQNKYMTTGKYSWSGISWTKRGRVYRELHHIHSSLEGRKHQFNVQSFQDLPDTYIVEHYFTGAKICMLKSLLEVYD